MKKRQISLYDVVRQFRDCEDLIRKSWFIKPQNLIFGVNKTRLSNNFLLESFF